MPKKTMKKRIFCLLLLCVLIISLSAFAACKPQEENPPIEIDDAEKVSTILEKPDGKTPEDVSAKESLYIAAGELQRSGGFKGVSTGVSSAMLGIQQEVASERTVVGENVFKQSASSSSFMKDATQIFVFGENYLLRKAEKVNDLQTITWSQTATKFTKEAWSTKIGYRPNGLTGYILNDYTIVDAKLEKSENGIFTFRYVLDTQKAPYFLLYEMKTNANAKAFSTFTKAEIIVTMNSDFVVQTLTTDCEYKACAMGLSNVPCVESITETFSDIGYNGNLPQQAFFERFFDASAVDDVPERETTAMDVLTGMMEPYILGGETLNLSANILQDNATLCNAKIAVDIAQTVEDISLCAQVGNDLYVTYENGNVLMDFQDFHASTTVEGLSAFISTLLPSGGFSLADLDFDKLLSSLTFEIKNGIARVNIPVNLAGVSLSADFFASVDYGKYTFTNAKVYLGTLKAELAPTESWEKPAYDGEYPEILGLADLIDNGTISLATNVNGLDVTATLDIATGSVYVNSDVVRAALQDNTLFAELGNAKIKFCLSDTDELLSIVEQIAGIELDVPQISVKTEDLFALLGGISATKQENAVVLSANLENLGLRADVSLVVTQEGWHLESVTLALADKTFEILPAERFETPQIEEENFVDLTEVAQTLAPSVIALLNAQNYQGELSLQVVSGEDVFALNGEVLVEVLTDEQQNKQIALNVDATVSKNGQSKIVANVVLCDGTLYLDVNGFKYATAITSGETNVDVAQIISQLPQIDVQNEVLGALIEKVQAIVAATEQELDLKEIASSIASCSFENGALTVGIDDLYGITADISLLATEGGLQLQISNFALGESVASVSATVRGSEKSVVAPDSSEYATDVLQLLASQNYNVNLQGKIAFGGDVFTVSANVLVEKLSNVFANVNVSMNGVNALAANVWFVDGVVFADVNGLRIAVRATSNLDSAAPQGLQDVLQQLSGCNPYVDKLLALIAQLSEKAQNGIAFENLIKQIIIGENDVTAVIDGSLLGITDATVSLAINDGIVISVNDVNYQDICANASVSLNVSENSVQLPQQDWTTNVAISLDEHNTLFAGLDFLNGTFNFKLENNQKTLLPDSTEVAKEPLFVCYELQSNTLLVKKGDNVKVSCNVAEFAQVVEYLDQLVKEFAGVTDSGATANLLTTNWADLLKGLSLQVVASTDENYVALSVSTESFAAVLTVSNTDEATFTSIEIGIGNMALTASPCEEFAHGDFSDRENFVALDSVLKDYLPTIESLVHTNSWQFVFQSDSQIDVADEQGAITSYKIAQGSWVKLYYNRAHAEDLMLRANVVLQKLNGDVWNDFVSLDVALIDGRIFVTYNNTLKVTLSLQALNDCTALLEELQEVIPQLADLMEMLVSVQEGASDVSQADFSEIIKSVSYDDGVFGIVLCGSALLNKMGDVEIAVSHGINTITLNSLLLHYDSLSLHLSNVTVSVSEIVTQPDEGDNVEKKDYEQYVVAQEILDYLSVQGDVTAHISFDSLVQLLRAVIDTAGNTTFAIDGTLNANIMSLYNIEIGLNLRIDSDKNGDGSIYVAALLTRGDKAVFADKGGYSYLFYNGKKGTFDVVRNSYNEYTWCSKCESYSCSNSFWHIVYHSKHTKLDTEQNGAPSYHETVNTETFTANILTYVLEMVNLSDTVEKIILDNVTSSGGTSQEIALEKLLKNYSYTQGEDNRFDLTLDLSAIDGNLGNMDLSVHHNVENVVVGDVTKEKFNLTRLNGSVTMASVVNMSLDLYLNQTPVFGDGKYFVENTTLWQNGQHAPEQ